MSDLQYYLLSADCDKQPRLKQQYHDAANLGTITCVCGLRRAVMMAYKCLYCGEWFCFQCAELHFGQSVQEWRKQKRSALAKELKGLSSDQIKDRIRKRAGLLDAMEVKR